MLALVRREDPRLVRLDPFLLAELLALLLHLGVPNFLPLGRVFLELLGFLGSVGHLPGHCVGYLRDRGQVLAHARLHLGPARLLIIDRLLPRYLLL